MDAKTKLYAVLGYPVGHSISPKLQNKLFNLAGYNGCYMALESAPQRFEKDIEFLREHFSGFNCTIPHKQRILPFLDEIDTRAKWCGSVNTVKNENGRLLGYSTDGYGFLKALALHGVTVDNSRVLILGAGGVARVLAFECAARGAIITIAARNPQKADALKNEIIAALDKAVVHTCLLTDIKGEYDLLLQCTPVGMSTVRQESPVELETVERCAVVFDTIYSPPQTAILPMAKQAGKVAINGFPMLIYQGVAAAQIWTGYQYSDEEIQTIIDGWDNL